jgi:hypothetical protein
VLFALHQLLLRNAAALRLGPVGLYVRAPVAVLSHPVALNRRQQLLLGDLNTWVLDLGIKVGELLLEVGQPGGAVEDCRLCQKMFTDVAPRSLQRPMQSPLESIACRPPCRADLKGVAF